MRNNSNRAPRDTVAEPVSDAATEPYEGTADEALGPTEAEMDSLEQAVRRLNAAVRNADTGPGVLVSDRMKRLAESLQRVTTETTNPSVEAPEPEEEASAREDDYQRRGVEARDPENREASEERESPPYWHVEYGRNVEDDQRNDAVRRRVPTARHADEELQPPRQVLRRRHRRNGTSDDEHERRSQRHERNHGRRQNQERRGRSEDSRGSVRDYRQQERRPRPQRAVPDSDPSDDDGSSSDESSGDDWGRPHERSDDSDSNRSASSDASRDTMSDSSQDRHEPRRRARRPLKRDGRARRNERRRHRDEPRRRSREKKRHRPRARNIKDLELPSFTPTPRASVSTWVDRVDLALKGTKESGRGEWSDRSLYFILGNKLMESAARWWVNMDRRLHRRDRTWTKLKVALLRRYGPRVDKSAAEARVNARFRLKNEPYADVAAGLREAADRNEVSERVFLAQFYRCLDRTVRQLVKQPPTPTTLEEAVEKAVEIDDPMDYLIGNPQLNQGSNLPLPSGDAGRMLVIPGVGTLTLPADGIEAAIEGNATPTERTDALAVCTNQQGVYNWPAGVYEFPPGQKWNGRFWATPGNAVKNRAEKKKAAVKVKPDAPPLKVKKVPKRAMPDSSSEDEAKERTKRHKRSNAAATATTKRVSSEETPYSATRMVEARRTTYGERERGDASNRPCFHCGQRTHWSTQCPNEPKCFACHQRGHFARDCTDPDAKKRNEAYLKQRADEAKKTAENENWA